MSDFILPDDVLTSNEDSSDPVIIRQYQTDLSSQRNRLHLNCLMVNFLIKGRKTVLVPEQTVEVSAGELVFLTPGAMLTSEILTDQSEFQSLLLYIDVQLLLEVQESTNSRRSIRCQLFQTDEFLNHFLSSLHLLMRKPEQLTNALKRAKASELLSYLAALYPEQINALSVKTNDQLAQRLKQIVSTHASSSVSVEELAFLSHMSLSTFKRAFRKHFGSSPGKWLMHYRLEQSHSQLSQGKSPSEVWQNAGYQDHSSFSKAFRRTFGYSPSDVGRFSTMVEP